DFGDIELHEALADAVRAAGWSAPTSLQAGSFALVRRGGNAVLWASPGSGLVGAYGLPLIDRLLDEPDPTQAGGPRALVLTPTPDRAEHVARELARLATPAGLRVAALGPGWLAPGGADVLAADVVSAAAALRGSALKLGGILALVVEGADAIVPDHAAALEAVVAAAPEGAQRILAAGSDGQEVRDAAERFAPKAMGSPARSALEPAPSVVASAGFLVVEEEARADALACIAAEAHGTAMVFCGSEARAEGVAAELGSRGFRASAVGPRVSLGEDPDGDDVAVVSYDVPSDADAFAARHGSGGVVFLAARELQHARRAAAVAGIELRPLDIGDGAAARGDLGAFRDRVARAMGEEDLAAQTLVLAPLVEEHGALDVAAALSALVRRRVQAEAPAPSASGEAPSLAATAAAPAPSAAPVFTRLFISVGRKDGAGPGDIVGAIAGESGVTGDRIGRIELGETHSIAEVATEDAPRVIEALNGVSIRGRSVRVDFDRPRRARTERRPPRPDAAG
ncbi:MAG: DbpA RNA binding domain-containing protein, partial [Myxococcota bacterium]